MIHLGTPEDLNKPTLKRFVCVVGATNGDGCLSFHHGFCYAPDADAAYSSAAMSSIEDEVLSWGFTLENNYVVEVSL